MGGMNENPYKAPDDSGERQAHNEKRKRLVVWSTALTIAAVQLLICAVFKFGDVGRSVRDFDNALILLGVQGAFFVLSVGLARWLQRYVFLITQLVTVPLTVGAYFG